MNRSAASISGAGVGRDGMPLGRSGNTEPVPDTFRRLTADEIRAYWLERFTLEEIRAMAAGIEQVLA